MKKVGTVYNWNRNEKLEKGCVAMILIVNCSCDVEISHIEYMRSKIRKERWEEALSKVNKTDKIVMIVSEYMLHSYIEHHYGIHHSSLQYEYNKYGKPEFKLINDIYFNVSHSGDWVVIGIHDNSIGVDVEKVSPIDYTFINNYFTSQECSYIRNVQSSKLQLAHFYEIWTCKESYLKMIGTGLSVALNSFTIIPSTLERIIVSSLFHKIYSSKVIEKPFFINKAMELASVEMFDVIMPKNKFIDNAGSVMHLKLADIQVAICTEIKLRSIICKMYQLSSESRLTYEHSSTCYEIAQATPQQRSH